ncbi:MAG TPA: hypothetical protein GYA10_14740, partial [Alphaproteobacteria bacterium]|nr:hypothetical protein [Alphaproteobacteria bacterium]
MTAVTPMPPPQDTPPAETAVPLRLRASLEALAARRGQIVPATVLGVTPDGLTALRVGSETLFVRLGTPLPAGMPVTLTVRPAPAGGMAIVLAPQPGAAAPSPPPQSAPVPLPVRMALPVL